MGKVKLTQEKADVLEGVITRVGSNEHIVSMHADKEVPWGQEEYAMNDFSLDTLIRALYIGYEVEQEFKAGQYVAHKHGNIGIITEVNESVLKVEHYCGGVVYWTTDIVNHPTPEEISKYKQSRWWAKHGRKVWEIRDHDVLTHISAGGTYVVFYNSVETVMFYGGEANRAMEDVKNNFSIKYFAEDRKDV